MSYGATASRSGRSADSTPVWRDASSQTFSIASRVPSLARDRHAATTESGVAPGAQAAATAAANTPAASLPYDDWWAPATSSASAYAAAGWAALTRPTGAMYIAAPQLTMLPTPASRGSTWP
ncbi:hypothetical protein SALBM217S_10875 [Streptomyces griseoloalbus]